MDQTLLENLTKIKTKKDLTKYLNINVRTIFPVYKNNTSDDDSNIVDIEYLKDKDLNLWSNIINNICHKIIYMKTTYEEIILNTTLEQIRKFLLIYLYIYPVELFKYSNFRDALIRLYKFDTKFCNDDNELVVKIYKTKLIENVLVNDYFKINDIIQTFTKNKIDEPNLFYNLIDFYENINTAYFTDKYINFAYIYETNIFADNNGTDLKINKPDIKTVINESTKTVFSLSDIHGDIHAFVIALRDCAKMIKSTNDNFQKCEKDEYMEYMLNIDLNNEEDKYDASLGYEWIPNDTYLVICGDMLDNERERNLMSNLSKEIIKENQNYPQIEIKLIMFINELNRQAMKKKSRIFKIIGNHDVWNILSMKKNYRNKIQNYISGKDNSIKKKYYIGDDGGADGGDDGGADGGADGGDDGGADGGDDGGTDRGSVFWAAPVIRNYLFRYNLYIALLINDTIYVHGNISPVYKINSKDIDLIKLYSEFNQSINNKYELLDTYEDDGNLTDIWEILYNMANNNYDVEKTIEYMKDTDMYVGYTLWSRYFSPTEISKRIDNDNCNIKDRFPEKYNRLIVGHCPQYFGNTTNDLKYYTITEKESNDDISITFKYNTEKATKLVKNIDNTFSVDEIGKIAGITAECPTNNKDFYVYHIDVGSSRAFDDNDEPKSLPKDKDDLVILYSRTPQILKIATDNTVSIIKSTSLNTRIHQPRTRWEEALSKKNGYILPSEECKTVKSQPKPDQPKPDQPKSVSTQDLKTKSEQLLTLINKFVLSDQSLQPYHQYLFNQHTELNNKIKS